MKQAKELYEALRNVNERIDNIFPATVTGVDKTLYTCDVEYDGNELGGVRLQSIVTGNINGFQIFPAVGSIVLIRRINDTEYYVEMYSQIDSVVITVADKNYTLNSAGHSISGSNGADTLAQVLTLIIEAVTQIVVLYGNNPDYDKLSQALAKVNNILI